MYDPNKHEKEVLEFWKNNQIFEKSVTERPEDKPYVFFDGPPFATGLPHYGHILSSVIKDVVPRYWTMKGYRVRRRWGWDCHGLPIEQLIEKELAISGKKDIEEKIGVAAFNEACHSKVLTYAAQWKEMVERIGRWVEFDNAYKTMDSTYMESVWWMLKTVWDKGLVYEGRKVLQYCPRCETPVSKAETAMDHSYKDVTEESITVCFKITNAGEKDLPEDTCILAWTTTPWTLPGNLALAVGPEIPYTLVKYKDRHYIIAKDRLMHYFNGEEFEVMAQPLGRDLVGLNYEPLFPMQKVQQTGKKAYMVLPADFVTIEEGTGIVHTAVMYGEDDYELGKKYDLPQVPMLNEAGHFLDIAPEFIRGLYFKKSEKLIKDDLAARGLLFKREQTTHSYPHCWRCDTALFYNAISAWFINLQSIKPRLIELNEKVNWFPEHLKHGRFLNILETSPDWNISRNRYWATALPFWKCENVASEKCDKVVCIGSITELQEKAINYDEVFDSKNIEDVDLHKHHMDKIKLKCDCGGTMYRIPEVIDCWVESGSMPYAELHYPFENVKEFEGRFPGQYIAEYIAQTRAWFYYMHIVGVLLFDSHTFDNVVTTGVIMNEKGEKMSKSKMNYPDPWKIIEQYGVDALRYYLMTSVVMQAENLNFSEREVRDVYNKVVNILWNVVTFYEMYAGEGVEYKGQSEHILDKWIMARLGQLQMEVTKYMDINDMVHAGRPFKDFIDDLSTWYLRRSRDRFKGADEEDKQAALATLHDVLYILSRLMAPFTPFISENMYSVLKKASPDHDWKESVHLEFWPTAQDAIDTEVLEQMARARKMVEMGLCLRKDAEIRVRQPLSEFVINDEQMAGELKQIIADELNIKEVTVGAPKGKGWLVKEEGELRAALNTDISPELQKEGLVREIVRAVNDMRKAQKLTPKDEIIIAYSTDNVLLNEVFTEFADLIKKQVLASELAAGGETEVDIAGAKLKLSLKV